MDEKLTKTRQEKRRDSNSPDTPNEPKASISSGHGGKSKTEEIARIDALATGAGVTLASFAHLDEKAILRKMDLRLIPMLALLYLLSFLDNVGYKRGAHTSEAPTPPTSCTSAEKHLNHVKR
jgi:hypothetical protein